MTYIMRRMGQILLCCMMVCASAYGMFPNDEKSLIVNNDPSTHAVLKQIARQHKIKNILLLGAIGSYIGFNFFYAYHNYILYQDLEDVFKEFQNLVNKVEMW